jgi:hypothetical protein
MKKNFVKVALILGLAPAIFSCSSNNLEKRIENLETRIAGLETKNVKPAPDLQALQDNQIAAVEETVTGPAPSFKFEHEEYDFGSVKEGEVVNHTFAFTNNGEAPLIIESASASCGCTVPDWTREPIPVGGKGEIKVRFDSKNKSGMQSPTISITANTNPKMKQLRLKGTVATKPELTEGPLKK